MNFFLGVLRVRVLEICMSSDIASYLCGLIKKYIKIKKVMKSVCHLISLHMHVVNIIRNEKISRKKICRVCTILRQKVSYCIVQRDFTR